MPSSAVKKRFPPDAVRLAIDARFEIGIWVSLSMRGTAWVPAAVPSLEKSLGPLPLPSSAVKYSVLPTAVRLSGLLLPPGLRSRTIWVPAAVPSLTHSSRPAAVVAAKYNLPPMTASDDGEESEAPALMSLTREVP